MNASSSLAKRAAALAASGCTKLLVMKSASEFSPQGVRGRPSRTASVSSRTSGGNSRRGIFLSALISQAPSAHCGASALGAARRCSLESPRVLNHALQGETGTVEGVVVLALGEALRCYRIEIRGG